MANDYNSKKANKIDANFISSMIMQLKLVMRLMGDVRINSIYKLIPLASIIYLVLPIDLIPGGLFTVVGAADDVAAVWFGFTLFLELCPTEIVNEHIAELTGKVVSSSAGGVVEGEVLEDEN